MTPAKTPRSLTLLAFAALMAGAAPAVADPQGSSPSVQRIEAPMANERSGQDCAGDYHARLSTIAQTQLPEYRAASSAIGAVDPALPGRLIFAGQRRGDLEPQARRALDTGTALARRQGRASFARDANTRWIAERIREDLTDYLRQEPTPFLCAGVSAYLTTLQTFAAQGTLDPQRLSQDIEVQAALAARSLERALQSLRPAPLPRFAPSDRLSGPPIDGMRMAVEMGLREPAETQEPTRLAERPATTQISQSRIDPDLPPLDKARVLASPGDSLRAITALTTATQGAGFMSQAMPYAAKPSARPVLARLTDLRRHLDRPAGAIADPIVRPAVEQALADIEVLDYLQAATGDSADPLTRAMFGTMAAIETAHEQACGCAR